MTEPSCSNLNGDLKTAELHITLNPTGRDKSPRRLLKEVILSFLQAFVLALLIINFVGRVSIVQGSSMKPSLETDNRVLINLAAYRLRQPERGDIAVFRCPINPDRDYIKRVIAVEGDTVQLKRGVLYLNGEPVEEPYLGRNCSMENIEKITIPHGHIFVMGDNRKNSEDSRTWGPLDMSYLKGKAQMVFWPADRFKVLP